MMNSHVLTYLLLAATTISGMGRQLMSSDGDTDTLMWLATVQGGRRACSDVSLQIELMRGESMRRMLTEDVPVSMLSSKKNCFVKFQGSAAFADAVSQLEGVIDIDPDEEVVGFDEPWHRDRIDQDNLPLDGHAFNPSYTGAGVDVHVLDTGIFIEHSDFEGRASYGGDFVKESALPTDQNGHGTHVSSTAVGVNFGVARGAHVYGTKVLSKRGSGSTSGVIEGLQYVTSLKPGTPKVISMSLGGGKNKAFNRAVEEAAEENFVLVAAGNSNRDACQESPSSAGGNVVVVGATTYHDSRAVFSNFGDCVDIFAPGTSITAASNLHKDATKTMSGTSMATPVAAGVAALLLEKNNMDLQRSRDEFFSIATEGLISYAKSPNLLVQIPTYTGPPTPPTVNPTPMPTYGSPVLCEDSACHADFAQSLFGRQDINVPIRGEVAVPGDAEFCSGDDKDYSGKILLVRRGTCLFFDKVKNAEKQGASAVLIGLDEYGAIPFPANYYGTDSTSLPSLTITRRRADDIGNKLPSLYIGPLELFGFSATPTASPTGQPTDAPTIRPTQTPTPQPTLRPSNAPTARPTALPTQAPTSRPTQTPTTRPTSRPTRSCESYKKKKPCRRQPACTWKAKSCMPQ